MSFSSLISLILKCLELLKVELHAFEVVLILLIYLPPNLTSNP